MTAVTRLVTYVDLNTGATNARSTSVSARLEAVLAGDRSLVLLDDRGWSWTSHAPRNTELPISTEEMANDARMVVGPDEPIDDETPEQAAACHWNSLADILKQQGVDVEGEELQGLAHDVVLSEPLRAHLRLP